MLLTETYYKIKCGINRRKLPPSRLYELYNTNDMRDIRFRFYRPQAIIDCHYFQVFFKVGTYILFTLCTNGNIW